MAQSLAAALPGALSLTAAERFGAEPLTPADDDGAAPPPEPLPRLRGNRRGRRLVKKEDTPAPTVTAEQRLLLLDTWQRSGLPAGDFAALVGVSKHTLYAWKQRFDSQGPAGLMDQVRGRRPGSRLPELTRRSILMLKTANPSWGCQKIRIIGVSSFFRRQGAAEK